MSYNIGLDLGTSSVGWAVTDDEYNLVRFRGKDMWGARLFEEGKTGEERRNHRSNRRRNARVKWRLKLLEELFDEEIYKIDPEFFIRLRESKFYLEDKEVEDKYILFNDKDFTDKDYHREYPTIYHLRKDMMTNPKMDIRLVYLAIHHIIKNRGHFLFEGGIENVRDFGHLYTSLIEYLELNYGIILQEDCLEQYKDVLRNEDLNLIDKRRELTKLFDVKANSQVGSLLYVTVGGSAKLHNIFDNEDLKDVSPDKISFRDVDFSEARSDYEELLGEDVVLLDILKNIYDWMILDQILGEYTYLSDSMIDKYEEHGKDLQTLKYLVKKYGKKKREDKGKLVQSDYFRAFRSIEERGNYSYYVGKSQINNTRYNINNRNNNDKSHEGVNKYFHRLIKDYKVNEKDEELFSQMLEKLTERTALPKLRTSDNNTIPYQIHKLELDKILTNGEKQFDFLSHMDESGYTNKEKIQKIMTFRIPYYVGPLNPYHSEDNGRDGNAWIVKKSDEKILPWNFDDVVDRNASAEKFIKRMTNKCTYLLGEDVIPKDSLLYQEYVLLNELNNLKIDGIPISVEVKNKIFNELFKSEVRVTNRKLREYLKSIGFDDVDDAEITGIDGNFNSSLKSYIEYKKIFGDKIDFDPTKTMIEDIILWKSLYGEDKKIFKNRFKDEYPDIPDETIKQFISKNYTGWSRLSLEFLLEIEGVDKETGEIYKNIMDALKNTNNNLMELLSGRYTFKDNVSKFNNLEEEIVEITYEKVFEDSYLSPAIKRSVWQTIRIIEEIKKINKDSPNKIFLEMTRGRRGDRGRTISRRDNLLKKYKEFEIEDYLEQSLENFTNADLRRDRLFLYYTQMGRCMYSGEKINLSQLSNYNIYDIDHIYPRSLTKDDSINNRVLVKRNINAAKGDNYPLPSEIRKDMFNFWSVLKQKELISSVKFDRLTGKDKLNDSELAGFIARQLVETSQSVKETADILKRIYPDTEIVYVKSQRVSEFRHLIKEYKNREVNNFHHAKDAYLNIVVGDIYNKKFTKNPFNFMKDRKDGQNRTYNLDKLFEREVFVRGETIWDPAVDINRVKNIVGRNTALVTRMPIEQRGELFNANMQHKKSNTKIKSPIKESDKRLQDTTKYGSYISVKNAYFCIVSHTKNNKELTTIEPVYLKDVNKIKSEKDLKNYVEDVLGLDNAEIVIPKLKMQSKVYIDGNVYILRSRSVNQIKYTDGKELILSKEGDETLRQINKYINILNEDKEFDLEGKIEQKDLDNLYDEYLDILKTHYKKRVNNPISLMEEKSNVYLKLELKEKLELLKNINNIFQTTSLGGSDFRLIRGSRDSFIIRMSKNISDKKFSIINESITGLYKNIVEVL